MGFLIYLSTGPYTYYSFMEDFYHFVLLVSFILSLFTRKRNKEEQYLKVFPYFLLLTLIVELIGTYISQQKNNNNQKLYSLFAIVEFTFYVWMVREILIGKKARKLILWSIYLFPILQLLNIFYFQGKKGIPTITDSLSYLIIVACCIYYFYELLLLTHSVNLPKEPAFWICTGLLFFYSFSFPFFGFSNFINQLPRKYLYYLGTILNYTNIFLYTLFGIAFTCRIKKPKLIDTKFS